ncbi:MAG: helix-turn-helix domain-containing protein [Actinomycetota bacterium]|nr:helix-turn-helix domain-containing protein [Actinomycetota bacterium]
MSLVDAALAMGLDRGAIYELIGRGQLDVVRVGSSCRVPVHAVEDLKARRALRWRQDGEAAQ